MGACGSTPTYEDVFIDVEKPTSSSNNGTETNLADATSKIVLTDILDRFSNYQDVQAQTTAAISNPSETTNENAWQAVLPNVEFQSEIYDFSKNISSAFLNLINFLINEISTKGGSNAKVSRSQCEFLEDYPVAINSICQISQAIIRFDNIKMRLPKLLGDLSYFRRTAPRRPDFSNYDEMYAKSSDMTMFFANASPLLSRCVQEVSSKYSKDPEKFTLVLTLIADIADSLTSTVLYHKFSNDASNVKCLSGVSYMIIFYDNLSTSGAFTVKSPIHLKESLTTLKNYSPPQTELINTVKYSKHFGDPSTPPNIKEILN